MTAKAFFLVRAGIIKRLTHTLEVKDRHAIHVNNFSLYMVATY